MSRTPDNVVSLSGVRNAAETRGVLLVSSNEAQCLPLAQALRAHGYRVRAVGGLEAALDILQTMPWSVVVLDHDSPDVDAVRFARMRALSVSYGAPYLAKIRLIAVGRQFFLESDSERDGIDAWLQQPFEALRLLPALLRLLP